MAYMEGEKGVMQFKKKEEFSPRFIGSFEILERVGEVAYKLEFSPSLAWVHLVFHVSMLRKYHEDRSYVLDFSTMQLDENLTYEEEPVTILDRQVRKTRYKSFSFVKDYWKMSQGDEIQLKKE
nr:uncharacterized protein LOC104099881 [Nicotiana tomentosiformis]